MDFGDFFSDMAWIGGDRGGWRSYFVIFMLLLGAGIGGYVGFTSEGVIYAIGYSAIGAFFGWILGVVMLGFFRFMLIFVPLFVIVLGGMYIFGGLG